MSMEGSTTMVTTLQMVYTQNGLLFVKSIRLPQSEKHKLFAARQEGERKDVECAFDIL